MHTCTPAHTCTHTCTCPIHTCTPAHALTHLHTCTRTHTPAHLHTHTNTHTHKHTHTNIHTCAAMTQNRKMALGCLSCRKVRRCMRSFSASSSKQWILPSTYKRKRCVCVRVCVYSREGVQHKYSSQQRGVHITAKDEVGAQSSSMRCACTF
jgi:hypothetical protein